MSKRIISLLVAFVICISASPVCCADSNGAYISKTSSYWDTVLHGIVNGTSGVFLLSSGIQGIASFLNGDICARSSDGYHYADSLFSDHVGEGKDGAKYAEAICKFCGEHFLCYATDLPPAYDDYVETLPAQGYNSSGNLIWQPIVADLSSYDFWFQNKSGVSYTFSDKYIVNSAGNGFSHTRPGDFYVNFVYSEVRVSAFPFAGTYRVLDSHAFLFRGVFSGEIRSYNRSYELGKWNHFSPGDTFRVTSSHLNSVSCISAFVDVSTPVFEVIPDTALSGDTYNITTRPTSITGGNYGIVGDNGQITKVEDNSTIINETNNTFYNPATGTTVPIVNWSYDYSDRSYKVTLESGDTATITYGDENITISQITTTEGDTITNNYTIYYLIDGSGSQTPVDPPAACDHTWTETNTTPATCTVPGSKLSTCSKCQQTKKEALPALGHDWQVKQTVTTEYDDTGQLIQEGYTIFECSRCHEQYKSPDGTIPPGGGSGTDPGSDEGETIWDKLGNLIGAIGSGVIGLIEAALGKVLDALIALVEGMMERLKTVVEAVLSIFDELPKVFGGFLDFLVAVFPFLPPELMTILTFGILAVVFIGIIKAVRR